MIRIAMVMMVVMGIRTISSVVLTAHHSWISGLSMTSHHSRVASLSLAARHPRVAGLGMASHHSRVASLRNPPHRSRVAARHLWITSCTRSSILSLFQKNLSFQRVTIVYVHTLKED
jgi:hypothetical protein